ncbi:hypothetical protein Q0590_11645 [Rhodocytophaga aerolata]|uniref:Uncharacterized protein n=1 Tax=Rhodocytophaga aerolata TaxID=455078 RepID=A0ABT8R486_9BACT|nr:hypothetical protein [Rhodocytophaga aerolata]MDO1446912.1 hypothetical protein [Rhodocytophaga aerolata]
MKRLDLNESAITPIYTKPTLELTIDSYNTQVQPLTDLMVEIITFQLNELALFSNLEIHKNSLN